MKKIIVLTLIILLLGGGIYFAFFNKNETINEYTTAEVTKGDIFSTITSTGTIEAVTTVEVGTQVSGRIERIFYDYNDRVREGDLLAVLDTTSLKSSLEDAAANLIRMEAISEEANKKFELAEKLFEKAIISEIEFIEAKTNAKTALANLQSAKSAKERAQTNLEYAYIKSPITGTIISRDVEEGVTVASSLQAPVLFTITNDLSNMEIIASVDESDIGEIKKGQRVKFTVPAYWEKEFEGEVKQIRLQPTVVSNVVNYNVVVSAPNDDGILLPGMTATIDFYINEAHDVLKLPSNSVNFTPTEEEQRSFFEKRKLRTDKPKDFNRKDFRNMKRIWFIDEKGELAMVPVETGIDDGKYYEVKFSPELKEGMNVIVSSASVVKSTNTNNQRGFGRGPGMRRPF